MQSLENVDSWNPINQHQNQDWALGNIQNLPNQNSQNMLFNLSKNLITYENSYKKHIKKIKTIPQVSQVIMKRKLKRKKIQFSNLQNQQPNNIQSNLIKKQNSKHSENFLQVQKPKVNEEESNNMSRLRKMFQIFKQFNSLNDSILPFKVNLNKISQKRILANMIFKDFNQCKENYPSQNQNSTQSATINIQNLQFRKNTIENDLASMKNRVYSLNFKNQHRFLKDQKSSSQKFMNNVVSMQGQNNGAKQKRSASLTRRKRTYSFRKPQNQINQKTIQEVCENYMNVQKSEKKNENLREKNILTSMTNKERISDKFSDSKFFNRRQVLYDLKSRGRNLRK